MCMHMLHMHMCMHMHMSHERHGSPAAEPRLQKIHSFRDFSQTGPCMSAQHSAAPPQPPPLVKVALVGDSGVGKTSLMVRYVEGTFDETQLPTQGVNFMENTVSVQGNEITFSVWDIGGSHFESMLPLVCNDAAVVLLMFDLCRRESLDSIRKWHEKARSFNKHAVPFLVGCKWDQLALLPEEEQRHVEDMARRFAKAIGAPLIFCAPSVPINVTNVFKVAPRALERTTPRLDHHAPNPPLRPAQVILIQLFGLQCAVPQLSEPGQPLLLYEPGVGPPESDQRLEPPPAPPSPPPPPFPPSPAASPGGWMSHGTAEPLAESERMSALCSLSSMRSLSSAVSSSYQSTFGV